MTAPAAGTHRFAVIAALDDSDAAHEVLRVAASLARGVAGGELHLACVAVQGLKPPIGDLTAEACAAFAGKVVPHVATGSPSEELLRLANEVKADMVVVGTHGRSGIKRMVLGSVAEHVVRAALCTVVVARKKDYGAESLATQPSESDAENQSSS